MLYIDNDYKIDLENKIQYQHLVQDNNNATIKDYCNIKPGDIVYTDNTSKVFIIKIDQNNRNTFYAKNVILCKEIAPNLFKIVLPTIKNV